MNNMGYKTIDALTYVKITQRDIYRYVRKNFLEHQNVNSSYLLLGLSTAHLFLYFSIFDNKHGSCPEINIRCQGVGSRVPHHGPG